MAKFGGWLARASYQQSDLMTIRDIKSLRAGYWLVVCCVLGLTSSAMAQGDADARIKAQQYYYRGMLEYSQGRMAEARALLGYSYRLDSTDATTAYALGMVEASEGRDELAAPLFAKAYEADPTNEDYMRAQVVALATMGQYQTASDILERWLMEHPGDETYLDMLGRIYRHSGEYTKALNLYTKLQREARQSFPDYMRLVAIKAALYKASQASKEADREYRDLVKRFPHEAEAKLRAVDHFFGSDKYKEALPYLRKLEADGFSPSDLRPVWCQYYQHTGDSVKLDYLMLEHLEDMQVDPASKAALWYEYARVRMKERHIDERHHRAFERMIELHDGEAEPRLVYAQLLRLSGQTQRAFDLLLPMRVTHPDLPDLWSGLVGDAVSLGDNDRISALCLEATKHIRTEWRYYIYGSIGLYLDGKKQEALDLLHEALPNLEGIDPKGYAQVLAQIGDLYSDLNDRDKAIVYYDKTLEADPDHAGVLNNYAYMLVEADEDLPRAERMAARAVRLKGDDANTLDTYAWILYKRGMYALARLHQTKAVDISGDKASGVMLDHLGDIYEALGDKAEAHKARLRAQTLYTQEIANDETSEQARDKAVKALKVIEDKLKLTSTKP